MFFKLNFGDQGGENDFEDFYVVMDSYEEIIIGLRR